MPVLNVPYSSQWDSDATLTSSDCGPTCVKMILGFYGVTTTTDEVFTKSGATSGDLITVTQLQKAITSFGFTSKFEIGKTWDDVRGLLNASTPVILLIHYGPLSSRQDKNYYGGHFVVCTGEDADAWYVNDPDFWGQYRADGNGHRYLKDEMEQAWNQCSKDGNPNYSYLVINRKGQELETCLADREKFWKERDEAYKQIELKNAEIDSLKKQVASNETTLTAELAKKDVECQQKLEQQKAEFFIEEQRVAETHRIEVANLNEEIKKLKQGLPPPEEIKADHTHPNWFYTVKWAVKA